MRLNSVAEYLMLRPRRQAVHRWVLSAQESPMGQPSNSIARSVALSVTNHTAVLRGRFDQG